jgi:hypothetical protein
MTVVRQSTQGAAHVEAVHARHDHVEYHTIRRMLAESSQRGRAIGRGDDAKARHFQGGADQQSRAGVVIHHQHRGWNDGLIH